MIARSFVSDITVDETGTEAAAATAVAVVRSMRVDTMTMAVDKPFVFALRDAPMTSWLAAADFQQARVELSLPKFHA
jgi:serine protease inhibitor